MQEENCREAGRCLDEAFATLLASTSDIMYVLRDDMTFLGASVSFARSLGLSRPEELVGKTPAEVVPDPERARRMTEADGKVMESGRSASGSVETIPDVRGDDRYCLVSRYPVRGVGGRLWLLCVYRDMTREHEAQEAYEQEIDYLLDENSDSYGAWLLDITEWRVVRSHVGVGAGGAIPAHDSLDGYIDSALKAAEGSDEVTHFFNSFSPAALRVMYRSGRRRLDFEYSRAMPDGGRCWMHLVVRLLTEPDTGHLMVMLTLSDINSVKTAQHELIMAAELDSMTGVLNHDATMNSIEKYLSGEGADGLHALLMVDRDDLKSINDTLGHQAGDQIIVETASALRGAFRDTDVIGRVGGDEFLVLLKNIGHARLARRKAAELLQSLQCICGPADNAVTCTGSIGVSFYMGDRKTFDKLYAEADAALYKAKSDGRNRYAVYSSGADLRSTLPDEPDELMDTVNLRTLINSIDGGILILRAENGNPLAPVFFSDSFLTMMGGLSQTEAFALYGGSLMDCVHPEDVERLSSEFAALLESGEPLRTTYRLRGADGEYRWLSVGANVSANPDGRTDIYAIHTNIEKLMSREEKLISDERRYRMAFTLTSRLLCEVDIVSDALTIFSRNGESHAEQPVLDGLPESLISSGFVHGDSAEDFRRFYAEMRAGKREGKALFLCRYTGSEQYGWASISYQTVFDSSGLPQKAIGSVEELPNIARARARLQREKRLLRAVRDELLATVRVNVSRDLIVSIHADEGCVFSGEAGGCYSDMASAVAEGSPYPEDAMLLRLNLSLDRLKEAGAAGKRWLSVEFRRVDGGEIRWTKVSVSLAEDPVERELFAFICVSDVEKRRRAEIVLPVAIETDSVMHLYTQTTAERLADGLLRGSGAASPLRSLAVIRMAGLSAARALSGVELIEQEQSYLGRFLSAFLDGDCIVGRCGDDGVMVFCPEPESDEWMRDKIRGVLRRIFDAMGSAAPANRFRLVCGVSTENGRDAELSGMLSQAMRVCDANINSENDSVTSFEEYVDSFRITEDSLERSAFQAVSSEETSRPLFGAERAALAEAMTLMLSADDLDASVSGALGALGRYYGAQRVYTLTLLSGGSAVTGQHEWAAEGRHSTMRQMTGVPLAKLPLFRRALAVAKPVVLDGRVKGAGRMPGENAWCFITLPVISDRKVQGFLCIENPEKHTTDTALPSAMIPMILHERERFGMGAAGMKVAGRDELTGLPDHSMYNSAMQSFNPDAYHSVGAMYVSAIDLRELNRDKGVDYGDGMLVYAAQALGDTFKRSPVYRMSGQEFAAIGTNFSREAFGAQCARVQSMLQRRYPKRFCFGQAWSDKGASARKLLSEAESLAHNGADRADYSITRPAKDEDNLTEIMQGLTTGRFHIYLQPQIDMRTGRLVGAEALARCRDLSGRDIPPAEFVHAMEEAGVVRELDYFVLDQTFRTLQDWITDGLRSVPLSVNFSRQTLRGSTVLASALAIRSRYDVPEQLVEIEVTESVGDYEPEALRATMDGMNSQGFRFALDDLGSEYSSLKTLGDLTFDAVKLDKSLIASFLFNSMSRSVVESIVGLCSRNGVRCIAEGVESEAQVKGLLDVGCVLAQGYYFGKPMPAEDFRKRYLEKGTITRRYGYGNQ